jgi:hypothetical protein
MPKKDHTELVCILDRSGSMEAIRNDAVGGFNTFLKERSGHCREEKTEKW